MRKGILWVIWLSFVGYTVWLNPVGRAYTWQTLGRLLRFQMGDVNSYLVAIFWMMGVWPLIYAGLMFADGRMQTLPAWPFFLLSNFLGILGLMPYLLLRQRQQTFEGDSDRWLIWLDRKSTGWGLLGITLGLIFYALMTGDWSDYTRLFQERSFVHLITLDWLLMGVAFPLTFLFPDDMARRGLYNRSVYWAVALVPLFGPLLYLCCCPPLKELVSRP